MNESNSKVQLFLNIENSLFREYLESSLLSNNYQFISVSKEKIYKMAGTLKNGILLLQSDSDEYEMIELSKKLKRVYGHETKIVFFSSDYKIFEEVENSADKTLQWPLEFEEVEQCIISLADKTHKILLIDDSKLVHNHLVPSIKQEGYHVYEAFDGLQGLEMAKKIKPDLIICDIEMPGLNGFEVCTEIRKTPEINEVYIVMSSTLGSASDIQKGFRSGVDEYIIKPVVVEELLDRIAKVFKQTLVGRENILILEQDEILAQNLTRSLRKQGFSTRHVHTVTEAIAQIKKYTYELIILEMDIAQNQTAMDLLLAIKDWKQEKKPSMILLTSRDNQSDVKMVMNMGISSVISRPFSMDTMLAATERVLADKRSAAEKVQLLRYMSKSSIRMASEKAIFEGEGSTVRAEKKFVSLFFGDIINFTSRCEKFEPKEVVAQINEVFSMITSLTHENEGDVDKFMGDACMLFWYGINEVEAAKKMVMTAFEIRKKLLEMNESNPLLQNDPIYLRMGMNSGEAILCDIGSADSRLDLTLIGDNVNLASRLEAAGKQYGADTILSEFTYTLVKEFVTVRELDHVRVVGKAKPVTIYELLGEQHIHDSQMKELIESFQDGMKSYKLGHFTQALNSFYTSERLETQKPFFKTNPSQVYINRCLYLINNPPTDWSGTWNLSEK
jgi:DNA-binding response OmpR family regulator